MKMCLKLEAYCAFLSFPSKEARMTAFWGFSSLFVEDYSFFLLRKPLKRYNGQMSLWLTLTVMSRNGQQQGYVVAWMYTAGGVGGGYSLIWPIRGCATGQGIVFVLFVLNLVYNSARVCPRQGIQFRGSLSTVRMICASLFYYKQGVRPL